MMRVGAVAVAVGCLALLGAPTFPEAAGQTPDAVSERTGAPPDTVAAPVRTESGLLQGVADASVTAFRGVPFAAPPTGALRWRPPQPAMVWEGVRYAGSFSPRCPQNGAYPPESPPEPMSEDCLYLNIWVPARVAGPLPVMVWIFGGGLSTGSASIPLYAGDQLATHGVVVVTVSYRLGALGFQSHPALSRESPQHVSGNYGFLDQVAALQWVHRNISAFGGDPDRVTVFGQSSGAMCVSALSVSPLTKGLLQRVIGQSGGLFEPLAMAAGYTLPGAEAEGAAFAQRAGAPSLKVLRSLSADALLKIAFDPHMVIDGVALKESPYDAYARGAQHPVDVLVGSNATEGAVFLQDRPVSVRSYSSVLSQDFPPLLVRLLAPGAGADDQTARAGATAFESDMRFRWDMWTWARLAARKSTGHVYLYEFTRAPPFAPGSRYHGMGPTHGMELPYVFGHLDPVSAPWTAQDRQLAVTIQAYWTNFARTGNPNAAGLPPWSGRPSAQEEAMRLGAPLGMVPLRDLGALRRIDLTYSAARNIAAHPVVVTGLALLTLLALAAGLVLAWRRRSGRGHALSA
jgi:para-nitrobenzyl esterase